MPRRKLSQRFDTYRTQPIASGAELLLAPARSHGRARVHGVCAKCLPLVRCVRRSIEPGAFFRVEAGAGALTTRTPLPRTVDHASHAAQL